MWFYRTLVTQQSQITDPISVETKPNEVMFVVSVVSSKNGIDKSKWVYLISTNMMGWSYVTGRVIDVTP
jgi:hypothetical protein